MNFLFYLMRFFTLFLLLSPLLNPQLIAMAEEPTLEQIIVDLRNPTLTEGILRTEEGGVITAPRLRIQAQKISYTKINNQEVEVCAAAAEGDLFIEFYGYAFVGERLEYDFVNRCGTIYKGRSMVEPWFFGGDTLLLNPDGSFTLYDTYATTSPDLNPDWVITANRATISPDHQMCAKNVKFKILNIPVAWIPSFEENLDSIFDSPIRYNVKWGSRQGHRFGLSYEIFSWSNFKTFLRLDYRLKRGLGGGLETAYVSPDKKTNFQSVSYAARDSSIIHPNQRLRYLYQGIGDTLIMDDKVSIHLSYDKVSDIDMPTDYYDRGLDLETAGPTELLIHRQEDMWLANLDTRVRVNPFQTVKQELPSFETGVRPFTLGPTGIISDTYFKVSYLDLVYGNNQLYDHDYCSTRLEMSPLFYRNINMGPLTITPAAGAVAIMYGNSPGSSEKYLALGKFGLEAQMDIFRYFGDSKHVLTPFMNYNYFTTPTVSPHHHYIFDIEDGWYRLNMMCIGLSQSFYRKTFDGTVYKPVQADLYTNIFLDTHTFPQAIPKVYADLIFHPLSYLTNSLYTCWNFNQNELDYFNIRTEWTINADAAFAFEYRHRSAYDWRKADKTNYILDSFRTISELRHSQVSDRRDTILFHLFWRLHSCWAFQMESRSGWNRQFEPAYNEFEIDLIGKLPAAWNFQLSYQHREDDDRISVYMSIGMRRPDNMKACPDASVLRF